MKRKHISKRKSKKVFRQSTGVHPKNMYQPLRGGVRL